MPNIFAFEFEANLLAEKLVCNTICMDFHDFNYGFSENPHPILQIIPLFFNGLYFFYITFILSFGKQPVICLFMENNES